MLGINDFICEGKDSLPKKRVVKHIIKKLKAELHTNTFTIQCDGYSLNKRFSNRVGGYAIEAIINNILSPDDKCTLDAEFEGYDIEIKSIKDDKASAFSKMFTKNEQILMKSKRHPVLVVFVNYTQSDSTYIIKQITIEYGNKVLTDNSPKKSISDASKDEDKVLKF